MSEYRRIMELLERYDQEPEGDAYTEEGIAAELDEEVIDAEEEAFMMGFISS